MIGRASALSVRGLTIRFGPATIVEGFDITCQSGSVTVLTGPNGAGKTTVLNALNGMCSWQSGYVAFGGRKVRRSWMPSKAFAYGIRRTFQIPRNWPSLNLVENISTASNCDEQTIIQQLGRALPGAALVRSPATLSLGQRRVLEMLRLLLSRGECKVALLDEPLSGLDAPNAASVLHAVASLRQSGAAVLIVDHEPDNWPDKDAIANLGLPQSVRRANELQ